MTHTLQSTATQPARRPGQPLVAMLRYAVLDFLRNLRMAESVFFVLVLPTALYLMFSGMSGNEAAAPAGKGNVSAYIMTSMAVYGAVLATSNIAGSATVERAKGWSRTLALSPAPPWLYVASKVLVALAMATLPVGLVMTVGWLNGAELTGLRWLSTAAIVVAGSATFALYGLAAGLLFRSETAVSVASGLLVVLSFFGNLFVPLTGVMLSIARFTPLYGLAGLARWPQLEGWTAASGPDVPPDELWMLVLNVTVWAGVFGWIALFAARRVTSRV